MNANEVSMRRVNTENSYQGHKRETTSIIGGNRPLGSEIGGEIPNKEAAGNPKSIKRFLSDHNLRLH